MARKKYFDDTEEQQENVNVGHKGYQNKKNLGSSPPRSGSVLGLGLIHHRARSNQKQLNNPNNDPHSPLTPEDSLYSVIKQLSSDGLTVREMPGDGNCLFRALSDQLEGNTRNHIHHRRAVVQYMRDNRSDFEPFVEDDQPFDKYVQSLSQPGTFAGNDAIVAFARLHNVTVVIHQLNSPAWLIHPTTDGHTVSSGREVHIAYHNGDHYNSVRKIGDDSDAPSEIRFISQESLHNSKPVKSKPKHGTTNSKHHNSSSTKSSTVTSDQSKPSNNSPYVADLLFDNDSRYNEYWVNDTGDIDHLVDQLVRDTGYPDPLVVRQSLIEFNFDMVLTMNFILSLVMSQIETNNEPPPQPTPVTNSLQVNKEVEALALDKGKVLLDLDTGIGVSEQNGNCVSQLVVTSIRQSSPSPKGQKVNENVVQTSSSSSVSPTGSPSPPLQWDSRENSTTEDEDVELSEAVGARTTVAKPKLSGRQKEAKKKRERKEQRRNKISAAGNSNTSCSENMSQYSSSSSSGSSTSSSSGQLRSLNI